MSEGQLILYAAPGGAARIQLRAQGGTVWLSQAELALLFATSKQNVSLHIRNILDDGELAETATIKESLTVQTEGSRSVRRGRTLYSLEMILAVGNRVRSPRATQFRQWATTTLQEYLAKGFVMNDERLKDPSFDYFDELLERIRDIRASETRVYQKVREILTLSPDYDPKAATAQIFYATIQNKMLHAVYRQDRCRVDRCPRQPRGAQYGADELEGWQSAQDRCRHGQEVPWRSRDQRVEPDRHHVSRHSRAAHHAPPTNHAGGMGRHPRCLSAQQ